MYKTVAQILENVYLHGELKLKTYWNIFAERFKHLGVLYLV